MLLFAGVAISFSLAVSPMRGDPADTGALEGTWELVSGERFGRTLSENDVRKILSGDAAGEGIKRLTFSTGTLVVERKGKKFTGTFSTSTVGPHRSVDLVYEPTGEPLTFPGIYRIEGDTLTLCVAEKLCVGEARPMEFGTKSGGGMVLEVYRRVSR